MSLIKTSMVSARSHNNSSAVGNLPRMICVISARWNQDLALCVATLFWYLKKSLRIFGTVPKLSKHLCHHFQTFFKISEMKIKWKSRTLDVIGKVGRFIGTFCRYRHRRPKLFYSTGLEIKKIFRSPCGDQPEKYSRQMQIFSRQFEKCKWCSS